MLIVDTKEKYVLVYPNGNLLSVCEGYPFEATDWGNFALSLQPTFFNSKEDAEGYRLAFKEKNLRLAKAVLNISPV
jgi:hypothetical protein